MGTSKEFGTSGAWKGWVELCGDVNWQDYGGKWARRDPNNARVWYVVEHIDLVEVCGSDAEGSDRYIDTVYRVDLDTVSEADIQSALDCCGIDLDDFERADLDMVTVEVLQSHGTAAPMGEYSDAGYPERARAAARRAVEEMIADADHTEALLNRPVNALGSTAAEYARGDFASAMERGVLAGRPDARLVAKIHGVDQWAIDDARPADFIPYVMGYMAAMQGGDPETGDDLAPEYGLGYERGEHVRKGEAPAPGWIKQG